MSTYKHVPLGEICVTKTGTRDPRKRPEEAFLYVDIGSVDNRAKAITEPKELPGREAPSRARRLIKAQDIIVSLTRPNLNAVAMVPPSLDDQICSTGFGVLRAGEDVLPEYLFHFVRTPKFIETASGSVAGALYPAITEAFFRSIEIPLPPLEEQRRIVHILNQAASIERLRVRASAELRALIPALFIKMFGDPITNPMGWEVIPLSDVTTLVQYGTSKKASETGDGIPVLRMGNVSYDGHLDCTDLKYVELEAKEVAKYQLQAGDILFNRTNSKDLVGKTGVWDGRFDAVPASYFIQVRLDLQKVVPTYVGAFMNTAQLKRVLFQMAKGAIGQANINAKELQSIQIPVPPLDLQQRYADVINRIQDMISLLDRSSEEARALSQALMAQLFGSKNLGKTSGETLEPRLTETAVTQ